MGGLRPLAGFAAGSLFGIGLVVAGMTDPAKVLNFLDIAGRWDPSLALVMVSASIVTFAGYRLAWRRGGPILMERFDIPSLRRIDLPLVSGAAIFGIGWGIAGFCPGPAWASLILGAPGTLVFLPAMAVGLWAGWWLRRALARI